MKAAPFEYTAPRSLDEVVELLGEHGDEMKLLAGGQSLIPLLAMRLARPSQLVDVNEVAALSGIEERGGVVAFGATARERDAELSPLVTARVPVLADALPNIGHAAIRNRGTIGGSIAHADSSGELPAVAMVTEAEMLLRSRGGDRTVLADDFFLGHFTTALADDECLVEMRVPVSPASTGWSFQEVARRPGDFAMVGAAAMIDLAGDDEIDAARICLMGVADRPVRAASVEADLVGAEPSADVFASAAAAVNRDLDPPSDIHGSAAYRRHLAGVIVRRTLVVAAERAEQANRGGGNR